MGRFDSDHHQLMLLADLAVPLDAPPPRTRRIYCNRHLRLDQIQVVGFDMDYTLAVYRQAEMDRLSIEATARRLVQKGYPEALLTMSYPAHFPIRGLFVDKQLGHVLKTDRYRYVKKAFHGTRELTSDERKQAYQQKRVRPDPQRYHSIDSLFALSEVTVFAAVIDALDAPLHPIDYGKLFEDVRESIDEVHRDGSLKKILTSDLERYLQRDEQLGPTLHKLRSSGKRLFLLTNSEPYYTEAVMQHLLPGGLSEYPSWRSYFDVIVTSAGKPSFFTREGEFEEVTDIAAGTTRKVQELQRGRMYLGGSLAELERIMEVPGDRVLYVGDHIFGDVLRAKKESAWRTLMIIQELTDELDAMERLAPDITRLDKLEQRLSDLHDNLRERNATTKALQNVLEDTTLPVERRVELEAARVRLKRAADRVRAQSKIVEAEHKSLERKVETAFHPYWGSAMKAEGELSSFGEQVERYACLYTDRVSNLLNYTSVHYFRGPRHRMSHE
jgi:5'-nucleotidase